MAEGSVNLQQNEDGCETDKPDNFSETDSGAAAAAGAAVASPGGSSEDEAEARDEQRQAMPEHQFLCSICGPVFTDPVSAPHGYNFCKTCLTQCWNNSQQCHCPTCDAIFTKIPELKQNERTTQREQVDSLENEGVPDKPEVLCDVCSREKQKALQSCLDCGVSFCEFHLEPHNIPGFNKHRLIEPAENLEEYICQKHKRPLELFCKDDQTRICQLCTEAEHKTHNIVLINQVMHMIKEREMKIKEIKHKTDELQMCIKDLEQEINELKRIDTDLKPHEAHLHLLQIYPDLCRPPHTTNWTDISVDPHPSLETVRNALSQLQMLEINLKESENLKKIQRCNVNVTLDPDTAHPYLILFNEGKQVKYGDKKMKIPDNPKRFGLYIDVLGEKGFSTGRFYYEVQVSGKTEWSLGVVKESINRKEEIELKPKNGFWILILRKGNEYTACADPPVTLSLEEKPQKVGVFVDYEEGLVSFYDVEARSHIYSFTGQSFTEEVYPFFSPGLNDGGKNSAPLIISPVSITD